VRIVRNHHDTVASYDHVEFENIDHPAQ
jgi:hypothetical protein